jgi:hypothetical protein
MIRLFKCWIRLGKKRVYEEICRQAIYDCIHLVPGVLVPTLLKDNDPTEQLYSARDFAYLNQGMTTA